MRRGREVRGAGLRGEKGKEGEGRLSTDSVQLTSWFLLGILGHDAPPARHALDARALGLAVLEPDGAV